MMKLHKDDLIAEIYVMRPAASCSFDSSETNYDVDLVEVERTGRGKSCL